jgi:hypothetical protein
MYKHTCIGFDMYNYEIWGKWTMVMKPNYKFDCLCKLALHNLSMVNSQFDCVKNQASKKVCNNFTYFWMCNCCLQIKHMGLVLHDCVIFSEHVWLGAPKLMQFGKCDCRPLNALISQHKNYEICPKPKGQLNRKE